MARKKTSQQQKPILTQINPHQKGCQQQQTAENKVVQINRQTIKPGDLKLVIPSTANQELIFDEYSKGKSLFIHGFPGTGKTFISMYLALKEVLDSNNPYDKLLIVRSAVAARDLGFLPGTLEEKISAYELAYKAICQELLPNVPNAYDRLVEQKKIEFVSTSFLRGLTYKNCIILADEIQNCVFEEIDTIISRSGKFTKVIFSGDFRQTDLRKEKEKSGVFQMMEICKQMKEFSFIEMGPEDIVRSQMVKNYILMKAKMGLL